MNLSINGQSQVPPGFRFHPTEDELLQYYLRKQVAKEKIDLDVISYIDLNKLEPWDIQERCKIGSTPQNEWYFFSHKDKKYPTGTRTNRATEAGFWKATGRDKIVHNNGRRIGLRKTLVFYIGRAPCGQKSDWIMYEYRLDDNTNDATACNLEEPKADDAWVVCRLFRKKHCKNQAGQRSSSTSTDVWTQIHSSSKDGDLDQILRCMTKPCKQENETMNTAISEGLHNRFTILPELESPTINPLLASNSFEACEEFSVDDMLKRIESSCNAEDALVEWLGLDQHVPSKINGQMKTSKQLSSYGDWSEDLGFHLDHQLQLPHLCSNGPNHSSEVYSSGIDVWSFT